MWLTHACERYASNVARAFHILPTPTHSVPSRTSSSALNARPHVTAFALLQGGCREELGKGWVSVGPAWWAEEPDRAEV